MGQEERTAGRPAEGQAGQAEDGIELEVSDLRAGPAAIPAPAGTAGPAPVTGRGLPAVLASRRARTATVAALVALVCAGLLLSLPGTQSSLRQALAGPTPTPTAFLAYTEFTIGFYDEVPWGTLTVDGKPADQQPGKGTILSRGRHTVAYRAAPFAPLDCRLSVPKRSDDTCALTSNVQFASLGSARIVDLGANLGRLPSDQRDALARAVDAALRADPATATVEPGDHYLGAGGAVAVAPAPLRATLALALNTDPAHALPSGGPTGGCVDLCDDYYDGIGGNDAWSVIAHAVARWQFAAADGAPIQPEGPGARLDTSVTVGVRWADGGWSVTRNTTPATYNDLCYSVFAAFPQPTPPPGGVGTSTGVTVAPDVADGCVELVTPYQGAVSSTPTPNPATAPLFLYRFGVLLAANDAAHAALPQLPLANAHERALALQWQPRSA